MISPEDLEIGAATHTGRVRLANEDDFLVFGGEGPGSGLMIVADGMGGVTGGAEASRSAVRALASAFIENPTGEPEDVMRRGFADAASSVFERSRELPALREMGTTLTALWFIGDRVVVGHVGDTRCVVLRGGMMEQWTEDHVLRQGEPFLTRCVGAGQTTVEPDIELRSLEDGDTLALFTDGVSGPVPEDLIRRHLEARSPQRAAEALVAAALEAGGPDNATALVVRVRRGSGRRQLDLPVGETGGAVPFPQVSGSLRPPFWPWLVVGLALAVSAVSAVLMYA